MYKLKESTLYWKSGENKTIYFLFTQYAIKAIGVPRFWNNNQ